MYASILKVLPILFFNSNQALKWHRNKFHNNGFIYLDWFHRLQWNSLSISKMPYTKYQRIMYYRIFIYEHNIMFVTNSYRIHNQFLRYKSIPLNWSEIQFKRRDRYQYFVFNIYKHFILMNFNRVKADYNKLPHAVIISEWIPFIWTSTVTLIIVTKLLIKTYFNQLRSSISSRRTVSKNLRWISASKIFNFNKSV